MSLLYTLHLEGHLRSIDHALAQSLRRLAPDTPEAVLLGAALASLAVSRGHAGFSPAQPHALVEAEIAWPQVDDWHTQLSASPWVATPDDSADTANAQTPLVLENGLLYLRRYREYERRLAGGLQRIGAHVPADQTTDALAPLFDQLFPHATGSDDRQARAAALALRHNLLLVTGGPGTGKTTTIARLLVLLVAQALHAGKPAPRIALTAPTGRAAERMAESVRNAVQKLQSIGIDETLIAALPVAGTTLHRLLGTIPEVPRFRHHADNPLLFDIVVVDEASMIDLPLMAKLVEAVGDGTRLVLLGDPDQLPSVEAGDVLSGILGAAGDGARIPRIDAEALQALLRTPSADAIDHAEPMFAGRRVHLQRGYRQDVALQLSPLADAVRDGDSTRALSLLRSNKLAGVQFHEGNADLLHTHRERLLAHWSALASASSPAQALALAGRLRILTAVREGPQGARHLNARIETLLSQGRSGTGRNADVNRHFHGRLLLITENNHRQQLFNGDIGICLRGDNGALMAWFPGDDPLKPRPFHPAALPAHESAFAMTVHKAQGSEFDEVWLLLPAHSNRVLSRELVYTGITRARRELHVAGNPDVLAAALARHARRWSGLGWRLQSWQR